jgi:uncharacterized protein DUF6644
MDWLLALENSRLADLVRSSGQLYAMLQIGHLLAMAALVGAGLVLDLRLIGLTRTAPAELLRLTDPLLAAAGAVALITGLVMFSSEATTMAANPAFRVKIVLLGLLFGNALGFQFGARRSLPLWAHAATPPPGARVAGAVAIVGWIGTVAAARLIAFT